MTINEQIAVLTAYKEGKEIQVRSIDGAEIGMPWGDVIQPVWDFSLYDYRVKPEPPKPKYRPYESAEEVMEAIKEHGSWIRNKYGFLQIVGIDNDGCRFGHTAMGSFDGVFNDFTWPDGTPFGVKEE